MVTGVSTQSYNNIAKQTYAGSGQDEFKKTLDAALASNDDVKLKDACIQFEQLFLQIMYKQMKAAIPRSELTNKGMAHEIYEEMLDESLMKKASKSGSLGIADVMYRQLSARG